MCRCDFLRHHHIQDKGRRFLRVSSRYEDAPQTNGNIYAFFTTCHPQRAKKGFGKGEALRLLRTNSSNKTFEENITTFKKHLMERGYPQNVIKTLSEVRFQDTSPLPTKQNKKTNLVLRNTIPPCSSKSQTNLNEEVPSNTVTTIAKPNLQRAAHDVIQKRGARLKTYS